MNRILVTGAGGFIGRHILDAVLAAGHKGFALFRRSGGLPAYPNCEILVSDLAVDPIEIPDDLDAIVHVAATLRRPATPIEQYTRDNALATARLGRTAADHGAKRFVYLSSVSIHGRIAESSLGVHTPIADPEAYGLSKYLGELALRQFGARVPVLALRLPSVLGAGAHECWLANLADAALDRRPLVARHPKSQFNNAVDVAELAAFILRLVEMPLSGFDAFPLGASDTLSIEEIVDLAIAHLAPGGSVTWQSSDDRPFTIDNSGGARYGWRSSGIRQILETYFSSLAQPS